MKKKDNKGKKKGEDKKKAKPKVNPDLEGFDIKIDSFGEISSTYDIDKINEFLNRQVDDKKLRDRDDLDDLKGRDKNRKPEEDDINFDEEE
jgi:hypothetical protein